MEGDDGIGGYGNDQIVNDEESEKEDTLVTRFSLEVEYNKNQIGILDIMENIESIVDTAKQQGEVVKAYVKFSETPELDLT